MLKKRPLDQGHLVSLQELLPLKHRSPNPFDWCSNDLGEFNIYTFRTVVERHEATQGSLLNIAIAKIKADLLLISLVVQLIRQPLPDTSTAETIKRHAGSKIIPFLLNPNLARGISSMTISIVYSDLDDIYDDICSCEKCQNTSSASNKGLVTACWTL